MGCIVSERTSRASSRGPPLGRAIREPGLGFHESESCRIEANTGLAAVAVAREYIVALPAA